MTRELFLSLLVVAAMLAACGSDATNQPSTDTGQSDSDPSSSDMGTEDAAQNPDLPNDSLEIGSPDLPIDDPCAPESHNCYPIVLAHGFAADTGLLEFWNVAVSLEEAGYAVYESEVSPYNTVEVRGQQLAANIDEALKQFGATKVNLVAHSMGGLDSRYVVSALGYGDRVASITTISTPHRGTALGGIFDIGIADAQIIAAFLELIGGGREVADDPNLRAALNDLSKVGAVGFNRRYEDDPDVLYQSWAGLSNVAGVGRPKDDEACEGMYWRDQDTNDVMDILLTPMAAITAEGVALLPHDGLVTVDSAKWGEFRGCIRADHIDEIGQVFDSPPDPVTGFDHIEFYKDIAADLVLRGL